jgi:nitroreductase
MRNATDIIRKRRSLYPAQFTGEEIPDEVIRKMLKNAQYAPTHKLTQPWRFTVFSGEGRNTFAKAWAEAYRVHAEENATFSQEQYDKMRAKPLRCSHVIAIGMKRHEIIPEFEEICAVSCAVQNMLLTASDAGAAGYWSTGGQVFFSSFKNYFDLNGKGDRLLGFLFLGMPRSLELPPRIRGMEDKVKWIED